MNSSACQTLCYIARGHETWSVLPVHATGLCLVFVLSIYFDFVRYFYAAFTCSIFEIRKCRTPQNRCDITPLPPPWPATSLQWPYSSLPKKAVVERFGRSFSSLYTKEVCVFSSATFHFQIIIMFTLFVAWLDKDLLAERRPQLCNDEQFVKQMELHLTSTP